MNTKSRSYQVRREVPVGTRVRVATPTETLVGTVAYYVNAGFRGIEVTLRLDDGTRIHGVNAGYLEAV